MSKTPEEIAAEAKAKADTEAATAAAAAKAALDAVNGFPSETPVADMTPEQQAAYWRDQAKKQQKKNEGIDLAKLQAAADELEALKAAGATDQEKALDEARREGENIGAEKYLKDAVTARFQTLTGKTDEEIETIFAHVDAKSFTDDKGVIDATKLKAYADTFGAPAGGKQNEDPVAAALARQRAAGGGSGSSISEKRKEVRESMTPTKA